jgi:hypothetical protein
MPPATPTSTSSRGEHALRDPRRFRRGLIATLVALLIACGSLGAVSILQGPKLEGQQIDAAAAAGAPGGQLRLVANQAVAAVTARDVSVSPAVPLSVQSQGSVISITFHTTLDYDTSYRVSVRGVTSPRGGADATLHAEIHTPPFGFDYLVRGPSTDRIMHATVGSSTRTVLYESPGIQDFAPLDGAMIVVRDDGHQGSQIDIVQLHGTHSETLTLPDAGAVDALTVVGTDILYTLTSTDADPVPKYDQNLFKVDLQAQHLSTPVNGLDGSQLTIDAWQPIPGTNTLMLHGLDGALLRYDPSVTAPPVPFAYVPIMGGLSPDQKRIGTVDAFGPNSLTLASGKSTRLTPAAIDGSVPYADLATPLDATHTLVRLAIVRGRSFTQQIALNTSGPGRATTTKKLYEPNGKEPGIEDYRITSNGRYLVVEFLPNQVDITPDGSAVNRQPTSITLDIVDAKTGAVDTEVAGFDARW